MMQPSLSSHIRIARPSNHFADAERFWVEGIGLEVLGRTDDSAEGGHALVFLGWRGAAWHLELVDTAETTAAPSIEDLLVLYLGEAIEEGTALRIETAGGVRVASHNPYWDAYGITFKDPDGYLCVLSTRSWG
jgi:catechol 2,3-dioxygenase-like lactoylglutathione lyase family enzyme